MPKKPALALAFATIIACLAARAEAHGGVSMEKDMCKLTIGPYMMHFTGYLPDQSRTEFCEDIPMLGRTVIVLDFLDDAVRDLPLRLSVLRQSEAAMDPLRAASVPAVFSTTPRNYPTGSAAVEMRFDTPGDFVGVVTIGDPPRYVSLFPFRVGQARWMSQGLAAGTALLLVAGLALFVANRRRFVAIEVASREVPR